MKHHPWTTGEERQLLLWYGRLSAAEIAQRLGCTERAIWDRAHTLGLKSKRVDGWAPRDIARLLGVNECTVDRWIGRRILRRQQAEKGSARWHSVADSELRRFIVARPDLALAHRIQRGEYRDLAIKALQEAKAA